MDCRYGKGGLGLDSKLSGSQLRYLLAVYWLGRENALGTYGVEPVSSKEIGVQLGVKKSSVAGMLRVLGEKGLIEKEPYGKVSLTPAGRAAVLQAVQEADILLTLLQEKLQPPKPLD